MQKRQVKINTTHYINSDNEVVVLPFLMQLSAIAFFFNFKDKVIP